MKLQKTDKPTTETIPNEDDLGVGQWYWVKDEDRDWDEDKEEYGEYYSVDPWLGCITHIGSNYIKIESVGGGTSRIHFDEFEDEIDRRELEPDAVIKGKVGYHQAEVNKLLGKIKQLTASLGITPRQELSEENEGPTQALAVAHGTEDIQAHKTALIQAKEKTLPDLFEKVEEQHKEMAKWMKAQLIPMQAEAYALQRSTKVIEDRIFTVELYAGLIEEVVKVKEGNPADNEEKLALYQRRHYMDEECLAQYEAGGMDYKNIEDFDGWMARKANFTRLLPSKRCIVAFRVRRNHKKRDAVNLSDFLRIIHEREADMKTYLYLRNGEQLYRLSTGVDFGEQLFPDRSQSTLLGDERLWVKTFAGSVREVITQREFDHRKARAAERRAEWKIKMAEWEKKQAKKKKSEDRFWAPSEPDKFDELFGEFKECTPNSVYYDDVMKRIARAAIAHNRIAVLLQGLLDRSPVFHPHPPWQLWTAEGFTSGIKLVYDATRVLTPGDAPDFEAYRAKLTAQIGRDSLTLGQQDYWERLEAQKENDRRDRSWRHSGRDSVSHWAPYGNPGPGDIAKVVKYGRKGHCTFEWERERTGDKWVRDPSKSGYLMLDRGPLPARVTVPKEKLFNISAYTPGDFKIFFADPRTRADYLKWAPLLLAAEDHHAEAAKKAKAKKRRAKRKRKN
jgi:hypothetical protein